MYVGGRSIPCDLSKLERRYFDYSPGVSISFNSHLLHGSSSFDADTSRYPPDVLERYRVSLTSVWLHEDDVDWSVVSMAETEYEGLYLSMVDKDMRAAVKAHFNEACEGRRRSTSSRSH